MNTAIRVALEKKHLKKRERVKMVADNSNYEEFLMEPESSKIFGFPDNSSLIDPDTSLLN